MIQYYRTDDRKIHPDELRLPGAWIKVTSPDESEATVLSSKYNIDRDDLLAAMDREEKTRIEFEDDYVMIVFDIPTFEIRNNRNAYTTIPLAIFLTDDYLLTVCSEETSILHQFEGGRIKEFSTKKRLRFTYQILMQTALLYQKCLKMIDKNRRELEENVGDSTDESDLIGLHEYESSLVYFATSLRANNNILYRLKRYKRLEQYEEDADLLDDTIVETQQAIEMTQIYQGILDGTENLMSTLINNRLNNVMKILTSITLILAIPTMITGAYGMNVNLRGMPLAGAVHGFGIICLIIALICIVVMFILHKIRLL